MIFRRIFRKRTLAGVFLIGLIACTPQQTSGPTAAIESYLQTRITGDTQKLIAQSCKAWESGANLDADSIRNRNPKLDSVACQKTGQDGDTTLVNCTGKIITNYDGKDNAVELSKQTYKVVQEDGQWKMCGYAKSKQP